jgi:metallo-beta-lactamase family protein
LKINELFLEELKEEDRIKFEKVLQWKLVKQEKEFEQTQKWIEGKEPCVFVSCGGMLQAGRAVYTASKLLPSSKNHILFCGYSAENSLATKIKSKKTKTVTIDGKSVPCRCNITELKSMTSHQQYSELIDYYSSGNFDKIAIVHSNFNDKIDFCKDLQSHLSKKNKTSKVICVNKNTSVLL